MKSIKYGASWKNSDAVPAASAVEVVAPVANVRGLIIWMGGFVSYGNSSVNPVFIAKSSVPLSVIDGDVLLVAGSRAIGASVHGFAANIDRPIFISPGKGLYFITTAADSVGGVRFINYDLL